MQLLELWLKTSLGYQTLKKLDTILYTKII